MDGENIDNYEIAKVFLERLKHTEDITLPIGWRLAKL